MNHVCRPRLRGLLSPLEKLSPAKLVILGYASYILVGWGILCLPVSLKGGTHATALDHLFTATSAVSTTGLSTVSTSDTYSLFGQMVVASLIQLGGLGYMTMGSVLVLAIAGNISPFRHQVAATALSLPSSFDMPSFLRMLAIFTAVAEGIGALVLYGIFRDAGAPDPAWQAIFHSISAFCTAGFGLFNNSFEDYRDNIPLNVVISVLSILGAVGFIVISDFWLRATGKRPQVTLTTRIILTGTAWVLGIGSILFFLDEPSVQDMPTWDRWMASFFQVMSASTTVGFNTIPIGALSGASLFLLVIVMIIGASPAGTGGGLKITTFTALWAMMWNALRGSTRAVFAGKEIPLARTRTAAASLMFYCLVLAAGVYALALVEKQLPLPDILFECSSALGTVGLSRGITGTLGEWGKWILIMLMFLGRVGPLSIGAAFFIRSQQEKPTPPEEDVIL